MTGNLRNSTYWASLAGRSFAWFLIVLGILQFFAGNWLGGIWMGLIGMFLNNATQSSYQQVLVSQSLEGEPVRRFMNPQPIVVPPVARSSPLGRGLCLSFPSQVVSGDLQWALGRLHQHEGFGKNPRGEWNLHTVSEVMEHDLKTFTIPPDADALEVLGKMQRSGAMRLLVAEGDRLVGIISLNDLLRFLNLKIELEGTADNGVHAPPHVSGSQHDSMPAHR